MNEPKMPPMTQFSRRVTSIDLEKSMITYDVYLNDQIIGEMVWRKIGVIEGWFVDGRQHRKPKLGYKNLWKKWIFNSPQ